MNSYEKILFAYHNKLIRRESAISYIACIANTSLENIEKLFDKYNI